jgi:hypothetical protein
MPFTQYVSPTFAECLEPKDALATVLTRTAFPDVCKEVVRPAKKLIEQIVKAAHALPIPIALVEGVLVNTPATRFSTFEPDSEFCATMHRALTFIPAQNEAVPATALAQIIYHQREYLGEVYEDSEGWTLRPGDIQFFGHIYYSSHYGFFAIEDGGKIEPGFGIIAGSMPHAPKGLSSKACIDAISEFGSFCAERSLVASRDKKTIIQTLHFETIEDAAHAEWDTNELSDFVKMQKLEFVDPMPAEREKLLRRAHALKPKPLPPKN